MKKAASQSIQMILRIIFAICFVPIMATVVTTKDVKQPLRIDLEKHADSTGYSLADLCWPAGGQGNINIVDFRDRSFHSTKMGNIGQASECEGSENTNSSPDGKWQVLQEGEFYVLLDRQTQSKKRLFSRKDAIGIRWSPDSRYFTYVKPGGNGPRIKFWEIGCPDSYRVWIWRVEDGEHDWVCQICKPGRPLVWITRSDLPAAHPKAAQ
jgi:hypothetical protein